MKIWTIQHKEVIKKLLEQDTYFPDLEKNKFTNLIIVYSHLLDCFNSINSTNYKGLIFGIQEINGPIESIDIYYDKFLIRFPGIDTFRIFSSPDCKS
ncbi:hypothetical protein [Anaerotignum propionicum]|uniref:hypothetical protein n=1 Tax=Anaerotignum propionicum TaxID=28446 RepID=UPI00210CCA14|nr:hypothetical protein [Anaerotignum propionicum]MCQ4936337.1 hypothetical protein [Anaerotignum propionicum]